MRKRWRELALVALSTVTSALILEATVRSFLTVRNVGPIFSQYDRRYGRILKRDFAGIRITPEVSFGLTTNSLGYRGPEPSEPPRDAILFLGDSFTLGYGVQDGEHYPELVGTRLRTDCGEGASAAVSFALGNAGNGRWIKFLRGEARRIAPRVVVMQVTGNDFEDNDREGLFALTDSGRLVERPVPPPSTVRKMQPFLEAIPGLSYSHAFCLLRDGPRANRGATPGADSVAAERRRVQLTSTLLGEALELCRERGWPVVALLVSVQGDRLASLRALFRRYEARVIEAPLKAGRPDLFYEIDGHWNSRGHEWAAAAVVGALTSDPGLSHHVTCSRNDPNPAPGRPH